MKKLLSLIFTFCAWETMAQPKTDTLTVFLGKNRKVIGFIDNSKKLTGSSEGAILQRKMFISKDSLYEVRDFNTSGQLFMTGKYINPESELKHGLFTWYYPDGAKRKTTFYVKNRIVGDVFSYDNDGKLESRMVYDSLGDLKEEHLFAENGVETIVKLPTFNGGPFELYRFLGQNIRYPSEAHRGGIQGKVLVSFNVCADGTLCDFEVLNSPHEQLSKEAIRVIQKMPKWIPGERDGQKEKMKFTLPVNFSIR
ncbi:MAG: TonB family protein [Spirosomataceae bacterium]